MSGCGWCVGGWRWSDSSKTKHCHDPYYEIRPKQTHPESPNSIPHSQPPTNPTLRLFQQIDVTLIYKLTSDGITVTVRVVNKEDQIDVPLTISWHPYLAVQDGTPRHATPRRAMPRHVHHLPLPNPMHPHPPPVSQAVIHSACPLRHVVMGDGAPRHGDLIPTGNTETWDDFDGTHQVGGNSTNPTYMDDEFRLTPSIHACPNLEVAVTDVAANNVTTVLFADPQFRYLQIYTGAMENWGESSIAVEPMVGKADAFNNGDGLQVVSADTTFEGTFGFKVRQA